ncbi:MAG: zf-HC2 domain-containing protein [Pyrinomonadaceae bacterium]
MDVELDKEIDALLRKTARSPSAARAVAGAHPDADEISAFAENALPGAARAHFVSHLSSCDRCREILAGTIAPAINERPAAKPIEPAVIAPAGSWIGRLFRFPNLAYALGGLVLVFAGLMSWSVLRNSAPTDTQISQVANRESMRSASGPSASEEPPLSESNASTTANTAPASRNFSNANSTTIAPNANTNAAMAKPTGAINANSTRDLKQSKGFSLDGAEAPESTADSVGGTVPAAPTLPRVSSVEKNTSVNEREMENLPIQGRNLQALKMTPNNSAQSAGLAKKQRTGPTNSQSQAQMDSSISLRNATNERSVGGRRFEFKQGVWYDTGFQGQATINIRRGTDAYRNLDAGLRSIADILRGTVVIMWKAKAYRIQ